MNLEFYRFQEMTMTKLTQEDARENAILYFNRYHEAFAFASKFLINASLGMITGNFLGS